MDRVCLRQVFTITLTDLQVEIIPHMTHAELIISTKQKVYRIQEERFLSDERFYKKKILISYHMKLFCVFCLIRYVKLSNITH